jgi:hypothetical protein
MNNVKGTGRCAPLTSLIMRLLSHLSIAHVVSGAFVDNPAPHERTCVPLQLHLLVKESVCTAVVGGGRGMCGAHKAGAVPNDENCCRCSSRGGVELCRSDQVN